MNGALLRRQTRLDNISMGVELHAVVMKCFEGCEPQIARSEGKILLLGCRQRQTNPKSKL
jgi:hypothetical protein